MEMDVSFTPKRLASLHPRRSFCPVHSHRSRIKNLLDDPVHSHHSRIKNLLDDHCNYFQATIVIRGACRWSTIHRHEGKLTKRSFTIINVRRTFRFLRFFTPPPPLGKQCPLENTTENNVRSKTLPNEMSFTPPPPLGKQCPFENTTKRKCPFENTTKRKCPTVSGNLKTTPPRPRKNVRSDINCG